MKTAAPSRVMKPDDFLLVSGLIDALPEGVVVVDDDDRVVAVNPPAQALFPRLRPDALLARGLRAPDALDCVARARTGQRPERATWLERVPVERYLELFAAPWNGPGGLRAVVLSLRDQTETRRVERMRVDFVANASHELRTPLASLLGFVETLQGPARDDAAARERFLHIMGDQARRMTRLVDDLLSLSRIEQHLHLAPQTPVDMQAIVRHIADTLTPLAQDNGVVLEIETESVTVAGDRDELLRVAENLVENAIKYGTTDAPEQTVEIALSAQERQCLLRVRDHGVGVAPEHLPRLTERFYRADVGQSRAKGGTGLGLAIVKHIVARHRGRLSIESTPGQGATFTVALPLYPG
ncbi:sensor histidine kinase [Methylocella sp.]|uniref:sensor histidine kinase n=1 Tax=Methylocella sp. TaxID=1978226 RepID=UPI0037846591